MRSGAGVQFTTLALVVFLADRAVLGAPLEPKSRAAELFEQGVRQFSSAQYEDASRSFLEADELIPDPRALINGITAARRAGLHLVVARASERALARKDVDAGGAALAREALAEAARSLTLVEVTCAPEPCAITLDGNALAPGRSYILPGSHDFVGAGSNGASATEHVSCAAGASYRVILTPKVSTGAVTSPVPTSTVATRSPETLAAPVVERPPSEEPRKPLPPAVFIGGAAGTAVLIGLTTWSGIATLNAKSAAKTPEDWPHVEDLALRTDVLLSSAIVLGAATAVAGLWFVDWGSGPRATAAIFPGGAGAVAAGQF
jgi:hypothetical protein